MHLILIINWILKYTNDQTAQKWPLLLPKTSTVLLMFYSVGPKYLNYLHKNPSNLQIHIKPFTGCLFVCFVWGKKWNQHASSSSLVPKIVEPLAVLVYCTIKILTGCRSQRPSVICMEENLLFKVKCDPQHYFKCYQFQFHSCSVNSFWVFSD